MPLYIKESLFLVIIEVMGKSLGFGEGRQWRSLISLRSPNGCRAFCYHGSEKRREQEKSLTKYVHL
jgi:hypothetical protein